MANATGKKGMSLEISSRALEEYFPVPITILGSDKWFKESFTPGSLDNVQTLLDSKKNIQYVKDCLSTHEWLGVDTETTGAEKRAGLDPLRDDSRLLLLQIGTPQSNVFLIQPELVPSFKEELESEKRLHIGHNLVFDFKYLLVKYGVHMQNLYDTMLAEQLLVSGKSGVRVGLAEVVRRYKPYRLISKDTRHDFVEFKGKFSKEMVYYAARDISLLFPLITAQKLDLASLKLEVVAQDEFDIIPCTAMMELGGVRIDETTLKLALSYWESRKHSLEESILKIYDEEMEYLGKKELSLLPEIKKTFDLDSPSQKLEALNALGYKIENVQRETLKEINSTITNLLAEYSETTKIISTYGENLLRRINLKTNRIHPEFNQLGSGDQGGDKKGTIATGRYSSDFQQLPKPQERYTEIKDLNELEEVERRFGSEIKRIGSAVYESAN